MQVVGDDFGPDFQYIHQVRDGFFQRFAGRGVVEIAQVLGNKSFVASRQTYRILYQPPQASTDGPERGRVMARGV